MNYNDFQNNFDKLVAAFSITNPEKKAKIYFDELKTLSAHVFAQAVRNTIRDSDRWPTIAKLLQVAGSIQPKQNDRSIRQLCDRCDGYGWVIFENHAFRGRCPHGMLLSKQIAFSPESEIDKFNFRNQNKREMDEIYRGREEIVEPEWNKA